jgi:hypothetical protein
VLTIIYRCCRHSVKTASLDQDPGWFLFSLTLLCAFSLDSLFSLLGACVHDAPVNLGHLPYDGSSPSPSVNPTLLCCVHQHQSQHTTPSSPEPVIDPAFLNVAAPNHSILMCVHNSVTVLPNTSMSSFECKTSPLSNPSGAESSTEPSCVPSSCSRKRKETKKDARKDKLASKTEEEDHSGLPVAQRLHLMDPR